MEFRHLRCFLAVAEELHFARAAGRLQIEQSPLSRAIKELEEDLGEQLFVRSGRSTRLRRAGSRHRRSVRPEVVLAPEHLAACRCHLAQEAGRQGVAQFDGLRQALRRINCGLGELDLGQDDS